MPFFVKRNGQAVPIVSDPNVINDTTASQDTAFSGSKVNNLIANHTHTSNQINAMTGYSKPSSTSNITTSDSLNTAIGKIEKGLEGKQGALTFDNRPTPNSNNPVTSDGIGRYISNVIGGVSALTFLQDYSPSVAQLSAGYVFTPQGAYNMYTNISNTIPSVAANVAGQIIGSAIPQIMPKAYWFAVQGSDWDEYGEAVIDLQNDFQIVIPQTNYNQLIVQDGLNYWNNYAIELHNVNTDESGNITTVQFVCDIYNTQDPPSNPPAYMEFIIISSPATKDGAISLSALYESPGLKALADKPNIDYTPSYTNTYNSIYIDKKLASKEITTTGTGSDIAIPTTESNLNALTIYGKSEIVNNEIVSAGESGSIEIETCGKNLIDITKAADVVRPDGVTRNGLSFSGLNGMYALSQGGGSSAFYYGVWDGTQWSETGTIQPNTSRVINLNATKSLWLWVAENQQMSQLITTAQLESGSATVYEPYSSTTATFTTGTPLRGIPTTTVKDTMVWDGSAGEVTKKCGEVDLGALTWYYSTDYHSFTARITDMVTGTYSIVGNILCANYQTKSHQTLDTETTGIAISNNANVVIIKDPAYTDAETFKSAMNGVMLIYELASPTTQQLTSTENASLAGLKTFSSTTHVSNNALTDMTVEAYAGTANGKAVAEIADKVDDLTPRSYLFNIPTTAWDAEGQAEIDVVNTYGYEIPANNYNELVLLSQSHVNYWRQSNVQVNTVDRDLATGNITRIELFCDENNIPTHTISFNVISTNVDKTFGSNLDRICLSPGLQVDASLDSNSTNPVQNKVIKSALDGKATPADIAALINDTTAAQNKAYSSAKVEEKVTGEEITTTATGSNLTLSTAAGNPLALTVYGKSEVVDGSIVSAGEGYAVVDLGTLNYTYDSTYDVFITNDVNYAIIDMMLCGEYEYVQNVQSWLQLQSKQFAAPYGVQIGFRNTDYTNATAFKNSLSGVLLCYQLADPTQGNAIAVKTDDGSGIDGTMATFSTGTPLRGIPETTVRDVMEWDGSAGTVTKNCAELDLGALTWTYNGTYGTATNVFKASLTGIPIIPSNTQANAICSKYKIVSNDYLYTHNDIEAAITSNSSTGDIRVNDTNYTDATTFTNSLSGVMLVYELATPTTQTLTSTENTSIANLRTFTPNTHAQNNAGTDMTVEAYAGTENGKAVNELKQDVQSEITALKITQSDTLTLTTSGWDNNAQTITYAHDTTKRNVIDVDPASVEEWASCGILATAETASGITFSCKTVPENALNFRVTSMGVN